MSTKITVLWVTATMFLSMGFVGNLKSILVRKDFEPVTATIDEIVDKDMRVFFADTFETLLDSPVHNSVVARRLLCQARKTDGIFKMRQA